MALHLESCFGEKRLIIPRFNRLQTATGREDLLYHPDEWERVQSSACAKKNGVRAPHRSGPMEWSISNAATNNAELPAAGLGGIAIRRMTKH